MELIGELNHKGLRTLLYWEDETKSEIEVIGLGNFLLVKGNKHYAIVESSDPQEFFSRIGNLGTFYDYLKRTFPSLELKIVCLTELLPSFVERRHQKSRLRETQDELARERFLRDLSELALDDLKFKYGQIANNPALSIHRSTIREQIRQMNLIRKISQKRVDELKAILSESISEDSDASLLTKAYLKYGMGSSFLLTISSQYYYVPKKAFEKALRFVIQDLRDYDVIIKQRARQGFHLIIKELGLPAIFLTRNTVLNPNNLLALSKAFPEIRPIYDEIRKLFQTTLVEDVHLKNKRVRKNLSMVQAIASILRRSIVHEECSNLIPQPQFEKIPKFSEKRRLAFIGLISGANFRPSEHLALFDMDQQFPRMMMIAGETGCGKTVAAKVIVENCLIYGVPCSVIDPTGQWTGFAKKCEDQKMLKLYKSFGMKLEYARSFPIKLFTSTDSFSIEEMLEPKISVFLTKGMEQSEMDDYVHQVVSEIYEHFSNERESDKLRFVLAVEEAHKLAPREKYASHKAINLLGNCTRELRKYGVGLIFITQMVKDFAAYLPGGLAIRGNTATKIQMRTSYEGDLNRIAQSYGSLYQRLIPKLPSGVGLVEFSDYGKPFFVCFRPTLSHPYSLEESELERLRKSGKQVETVEKLLKVSEKAEEGLSEEEIVFLDTVSSFHPRKPTISELISILKNRIPSVGKIYRIRDELLRKGLIKIVSENGKKRICVENCPVEGKFLEFGRKLERR